MYLNNEEVGTLEMKQFFKSGGKQQLPYTFNYKSEVFDVSNRFSNETKITVENDVVLTQSVVFRYFKSKRTKTWGKHTIHIHSTRVEKEILLAIYLQCMINKQTQ